MARVLHGEGLGGGEGAVGRLNPLPTGRECRCASGECEGLGVWREGAARGKHTEHRAQSTEGGANGPATGKARMAGCLPRGGGGLSTGGAGGGYTALDALLQFKLQVLRTRAFRK
jgi:hypothetical protein